MPTTLDLPKTLGSPALRALHGAGITSLAQLEGYAAAEIAELHGVGPRAIRLLEAALKEHGLKFAERERPKGKRDEQQR